MLLLTGRNISSLVVDTLCDQAGQNTAIACFYFDYTSQKEQSPTNMLGSLLKQVVAGLEEIPEHIAQAFKGGKRFLGGRGLQLSQIVELLEITLSSQPTFLCIDALDECIAAHRLKVLGSLRQILQKSPDTRIFLTGRAHVRGEIESRLGRVTVTLFISPKKEDIHGYLRARLDEDTNPDAMDDCLEADIFKKIPETVSEMYVRRTATIRPLPKFPTDRCASRFLLVSLNIDAVLQETTIYRRRQRLGVMTAGLGLGDAYEITLARIKAQGGEKARLGMAALMWICYSERPLRVDELCQALAVEIGSPAFNPDNVPPISTLLGCCQGLVIVDKRASNVRLIHFSLKEYLCAHPDLFAGAHSTIAETCLTYLNSQHVNSIPPTFDGIREVPFLQYSSVYWGSHAKRELSNRAQSLAIKLFSQYGSHISARVLVEDQAECPWIFGPPEGDFMFTKLHCTSIFGIAELASTLIKMEDCDLNQRDCAGFTPLIWAAQYGHEQMVELLLAQKNVDPDRSDTPDNRSPLWWAALNGHEGVLKLLLAREDVNPERRDNYGQTPFSHAAAKGHEGVLKLLLAREDVNPETLDNNGRTPFSYAAHNGHEGVLKLLLAQNDVDPDRPDNDGRAPLHYAACWGNKGVVELLLRQEGIDLDRIDNYGKTALQGATARRQDAIVRLLEAHKTTAASTP